MVIIWTITYLVGLIAVIDIMSRHDKFIRKYYLVSPIKFFRMLQLRSLIKGTNKLLSGDRTHIKNLDDISKKKLYKWLTQASVLNLRAIKLKDSTDAIFLPLVEQVEKDTRNFGELCEKALRER